MNTKLTLLAASVMALSACGGGSSNSEAPTYTIKGSIAASGNVSGSLVCVDLNENFSCDANEPKANADSVGEFAITHSSKDIYSRPLVAQVENPDAAPAANAAANIANLIAPARQLETGNVINAVSSLLAGAMAEGMTLSQADAMLKEQLTKAGINLSGSVLDALKADELDVLEKNVALLLTKFADKSRVQQVALLSQNLSNDLASKDMAEQELVKLASELTQLAENPVTLNDTGVTLYFSDSDSNQDVAAPQADYPGQDADYGFDKTDVKAGSGKGFDFVKLDNQGQELADDAKDWSCVLDKRTSLIWENKLDDDKSFRHKDRTFTLRIPGSIEPHADDLAEATCAANDDDSMCTTQDYIEYLNTQKLCGISQWRLPTDMELYNLIDFGETQVDGDGEVYGLTYKYFPQQGAGSPDYEAGAVWHSTAAYTTYSASETAGTFQFPIIATRGTDYRGEVSFVEINTDKVEPNYGYSYLFPVRLVTVKGE